MLSNGEKIAEENVTKLSVKMWVEGRTMHDFWVEIKKYVNFCPRFKAAMFSSGFK